MFGQGLQHRPHHPLTVSLLFSDFLFKRSTIDILGVDKSSLRGQVTQRHLRDPSGQGPLSNASPTQYNLQEGDFLDYLCEFHVKP